MSEPVSSQILNEMVDYYRARANSLAARFASFGFDITVRETATYFLYGNGTLGKTLE